MAKGLDLGLTLRDGESIEYSEHGWNGPLYVHLVLTVLTAGLWLLYAIPTFVINRRKRLTITTNRVVSVSGIVIRNQRVFERDRVQHLSVKQGPLASSLDYGDIVIETAGATVPVVFTRMDRARAVRELVS